MNIERIASKIVKSITASKWNNISSMVRDLEAMYDQVEDWAEMAGPEIAEARLHPAVTNVVDDAKKSLRNVVFSLKKLENAVKTASVHVANKVEIELTDADLKAPGGVYIDTVKSVGYDGKRWWWKMPSGLTNSYADSPAGGPARNKFRYALSQELRSQQKADSLIGRLEGMYKR